MALFLHDCPHCGARQATFTTVAIQKQSATGLQYNLYASCPVCHQPVVAVVSDIGQGGPSNRVGNLHGQRGVEFREIYPKRSSSDAPADTPAAAARAFVEGAQSLSDQRCTAAVAMFRRALEIALKNFAPDVQAWKLEKRIDALAKAGLITKELQSWAHKVRLEGNEAVHEEEEPTIAQAQELQLFTEMLLTYLYTLPAKVKAHLPPED